MNAWPLRLMIYAGGEAVNGAGALAPQIRNQLNDLSRICTNPTIAATAQMDASEVPTIRLVLDPAGRQPVQSLTNVNVGNPANLTDFLAWNEAICPAERRVLILSGHGLAWKDAQATALLATRAAARGRPAPPARLLHPRALFGTSARDPGTRALLINGGNRDFLSNAELGAALHGAALRQGRRFDALVFDACLMSAWELLHELRGAAVTAVASVDELSAAGIPLATAAAALTRVGGAATPQDIARNFVQSFRPMTDFDSCVAIDLGAAAWAQAAAALRDCSVALLDWIGTDPELAQAVRTALELATTSLVRFRDGGLADGRSLALALGGLAGVPTAVATSAAAMDRALTSCVLARSAGADYREALGLSLFAPPTRRAYLDNRADYTQLQLPTQTGWIHLLDRLHGLS